MPRAGRRTANPVDPIAPDSDDSTKPMFRRYVRTVETTVSPTCSNCRAREGASRPSNDFASTIRLDRLSMDPISTYANVFSGVALGSTTAIGKVTLSTVALAQPIGRSFTPQGPQSAHPSAVLGGLRRLGPPGRFRRAR